VYCCNPPKGHEKWNALKQQWVIPSNIKLKSENYELLDIVKAPGKILQLVLQIDESKDINKKYPKIVCQSSSILNQISGTSSLIIPSKLSEDSESIIPST